MLSESPFGFFVEKTIVKKIKRLLFCDVTIESSERGGIIMRWRKREVVSRRTIPSLSADMSGIGIVSVVIARDLHVAQLDLVLGKRGLGFGSQFDVLKSLKLV